ncbi:MAG: hypothetical protein NVSMB10_09890 [Steroidobacteraceae bacterium]
MSNSDPEGYYAILAVTPDASPALIKSAYRHRAMELHPDRNNGADATAKFQLLQLAFSELGNPKRRARYDRLGAASNITQPVTQDAPIECSVCLAATAQPRYVIYWEIKSAVFVTLRAPVQGVFCPECSEKKALRASLVTWIAGWWCVPYGPWYSLRAILGNLLGGEKPVLANAKILTQQAVAYSLRGNLSIAAAIARDACQFVEKLPSAEPMREKLMADCRLVLDASDGGAEESMPNEWTLWQRAFYVQGAALLAACAMLFRVMQNFVLP